MTLAAHLDIETRSTVDLKPAGLHRYFEDPETDVLVVRWSLGDLSGGLADLLMEGTAHPFLRHIAEGGEVRGHNIAFDRNGWNAKIAPFYGWPTISIEQTDCTQARCAAMALPQGLDGAGKALNLKITKDVEGHRLMMRMCKPKKRHEDGAVEWHETPDQIQRLSDYCAHDVASEAEIDRVLPPLSPSEKRVWVLDQKINERGVQLDVPLVRKALAVVEQASVEASNTMFTLTGGEVQRTTEAAKIVTWLNARGIIAESIAKGEIDDLIIRCELWGDDLARRVIELRRAAAKSSVAKYRAMLACACKDGRARGTLAYHGAATGRWAGRLIQPQNLPRILGYAGDVDRLHQILAEHDDPRAAFSACLLEWENPLEILSRALRSMIVAAPGKTLIGGDYSNIEGRVNAWLAGEDWKVEAFYKFDRGEGPDLYNVMAGKILGKPHDQVTSVERLCPGKVPELACGYQGGVRAFAKMAGVYGVHVPETIALDTVTMWRETNPAIVASWYELRDAAIAAVRSPGMKVPCRNGRIQYLVSRGVLWCRLPSGRVLSYVAPSIESGECVACHGKGAIISEDPEGKTITIEECLDCFGRGWVKARVAYMGVESTTKQWKRQRLYGGLQCENVVQGIARDILVEGMFRLEGKMKALHPDGAWRDIVSDVVLEDGTIGPAVVMREYVVDGYRIVLTVHDEVICEVPEGFGSPEELASLMSVVPDWAEGLPVAVSPWGSDRYVK